LRAIARLADGDVRLLLHFVFHISLRRHFRLSQYLGGLHPFGMLGAVGERLPRGFRPAATLAHMVERCPFRLDPRLFGAGEEELQGRIADDRSGQAYSASFDGAAASSADFRFTALVLPRLSCSRS